MTLRSLEINMELISMYGRTLQRTWKLNSGKLEILVNSMLS